MNLIPNLLSERTGSGIKTKSLWETKGFCTGNGNIIEHLYGFLMIVERILQKHADKIEVKKEK